MLWFTAHLLSRISMIEGSVRIILILWHTGFTGSQYTGSNGYNFEFWIMSISSLAYDIFPTYNIGTPINIHIALHKTTIHSSVRCTFTLNAFQHALHCFLTKERKYWRFQRLSLTTGVPIPATNRCVLPGSAEPKFTRISFSKTLFR